MLALYTYLSDILYLIIRRPLTVGLIVAADNLRAIQASAESIITPDLVGALVMAPICTVLIASILVGLAPEELKRMRSAFLFAHWPLDRRGLFSRRPRLGGSLRALFAVVLQSAMDSGVVAVR